MASSFTGQAAVPRAAGKRKRPGNIKALPEAQQVFKGLVFFFFPNNDTNTARRMRITKAVEFGATWVVDWSDEVTHVIVDKNVKFDSMVDYLKLTTFPGQSIVVNECYPADCIIYRTLVNPKQTKYQVQGYVPATVEASIDNTTTSTAQSSHSLQLKPAKKDLAREAKTPSETDEESEVDVIPDTVKAKRVQENTEQASGGEYDDALEEIISQAKGTPHLPIDIDDDENSSPNASEAEETDTEDERPKKIPRKKTGPSNEHFQCMQKHDGKSTDTNPNAKTIEILTAMGDYYEQTRDEWRSRAYRKAISSLRKQNHKITTKEEALELPWVGSRLATKIEEIVWTNHLRRLDNARLEPTTAAMQTFLGIYGVGLSQAMKWVQRGLKTLADLETHNVPLTANQRVGIAHYADFNARIPRAEVALHADVVRRALSAIDPSFTVTVAGSYRRGAATSGDIDCLISAPGATLTRLQAVVFEELVPALQRAGFLKAALAASASGGLGSGSGTKWHGASALPISSPSPAPSTGTSDGDGSAPPPRGIWRRIDLLLVPASQLGAAQLYFTGNDIFNRSVRLLASRKGMRLNQRGLYRDVLRGGGREKISEGELVEGRCERRIFDVLGVPWRPPEHRIC
ncbi:uncharacterized protein K452DRAFT_220753 [Aplosporella prunicola CBS 121167]|uniref:DNA polymerase n=1 Tax=Aplosporella prunicola CBS 121167 TaxID=1176127 RepID=A0A6A6BNW2_9PEZI|nr:uncharacterized protein K452DRAFT_220753 [Aplosporella prunicola CBS 121167]KAF2145820.1 hypothetical protein K452DRAFT_220753 [Aplosporella prunicola CBS 121167]